MALNLIRGKIVAATDNTGQYSIFNALNGLCCLQTMALRTMTKSYEQLTIIFIVNYDSAIQLYTQKTAIVSYSGYISQLTIQLQTVIVLCNVQITMCTITNIVYIVNSVYYTCDLSPFSLAVLFDDNASGSLIVGAPHATTM